LASPRAALSGAPLFSGLSDAAEIETMPKIKTNRSAAKRFRVTKNGKIKRQRAGKRHLLSSKAAERKRRLRKSAIAKPADTKRIKRMLGLIG
jgi:large subunit ribosomal protein L35